MDQSINVSIFKIILKVCRYDENYTNAKYVVQRILGSQQVFIPSFYLSTQLFEQNLQEFDVRGRMTVAASSLREICQIWGMEDDYNRRKGLKNIGRNQMDVEEAERPGGREIGLRLVGEVFVAEVTFPP